MNQIYPDAGLIEIAKRIVTPSVNYHLFTNNPTVDRATVLGDFAEMAIAGYAVVNVAVADFSLSGVTAHIATILGLPISFLNGTGAPVDAYGYYVTDAGNTILLACAKFDAPPISKAAGASWLVTPILGDFSALFS